MRQDQPERPYAAAREGRIEFVVRRDEKDSIQESARAEGRSVGNYLRWLHALHVGAPVPEVIGPDDPRSYRDSRTLE